MDAISALGILNTGANLVSNDSEKQQQYTLDLMKQQHNYNVDAMKEQEAASLRMFQATGYGAKVRQLKEAGLNPALIYGMGGAGGGTTGNISAPQVSQGSAPNVAAATANKTAATGMALQLAKLQSEIKVNESVAEVNKAEAEKKSGIDTEKVGQEIANLQSTREGQILENYNSKLNNAILSATAPDQIHKIKYIAEEAGEQLEIVKNNRQISDATKDAAIAQTHATLHKTLAETLKAESEKKLSDEQAKKIIAEIAQKWTEIGQNYDKMQIEISRILYDNNAAMDREKLRVWGSLANSVFGYLHKDELEKGMMIKKSNTTH